MLHSCHIPSDPRPFHDSYFSLIIAMATLPPRGDERKMKTWATYNHSEVAVIFVVGTTPKKENMKSIEEEHQTKNDMVLISILDSYNNLTIKVIALFYWAATYCSEVNFVFKTDDDMFLNIPKLVQLTEKYRYATRTIFGYIAHKWNAHRNQLSRYFVSREEFPLTRYPKFATGPGYLVTRDAVIAILEKVITKTKFFKLEDVYLTGIIADELNITRKNVRGFHNYRKYMHLLSSPYKVLSLYTVHEVDVGGQFYLWNILTGNVCNSINK
ncbi:beta-1,3-galactosyltransferase 5-like [Periplaneta americana]|uniref:beta-1,3-galactosyltransferase 5-like n=1 Tax=Periplaneta americana TaxID=6978 RepID=UPI0037E85034